MSELDDFEELGGIMVYKKKENTKLKKHNIVIISPPFDNIAEKPLEKKKFFSWFKKRS